MSLWQKLIVVLLAAAILAGAAHFTRLTLHTPGSHQHVPWVTYVHPNVEKLKEAQGLVDAGMLSEAREILVKALTTAPVSPVTRELHDLLGAINTQLFFAKESSPRKTGYTVTSGDALSLIARKLQSSTDAIMHVNELDSTLIRPGEKLLVPRLDFTITIDLPHERVVVHDSRGFFTQYPIASADLPPSRATKIETKVRAKSFWKDGRPVTRNFGSSKEAAPRIYLRTRGYILHGVDETSEVSDSKIDVEDEEDATEPRDSSEAKRLPQGIAMLEKDIAQLDLLIRTGTPVTIIRESEQ